MTSEDAATLAILLEADRPMLAMEIGRASGRYQRGNETTWRELGSHLVSKLVKVKAVARCGRKPLRFEITERGRLALALWAAQQRRKDGSST